MWPSAAKCEAGAKALEVAILGSVGAGCSSDDTCMTVRRYPTGIQVKRGLW